MNALLVPFVEICLFRRGPQDLPDSPLLLGLCLACHLLTGTILWGMHLDLGQAIAASLSGTTLLVLLTTSLLVATGHRARIAQTVSALTGADILLGVATVALLLVAGVDPESSAQPQGLGLVGILFLALLFWYVAVFGHVLRHALSVSPLVGMLISLVFFTVFIVVLEGLFPSEP